MNKHYYDDDEYQATIELNEDDELYNYEVSKQIDEQSTEFLKKARKLWKRVMKPYLKRCTIKQPIALLEYPTHGISTYKFIDFIIKNNKSVKDIFNGKYVDLHN
jgi:hypothetical protein